jgi:hypothetical protein
MKETGASRKINKNKSQASFIFLNSEIRTSYTGALPLEPHLQLFQLW